MNEDLELQADRVKVETENTDTKILPVDDDRYPGSFFRIPRPPIAGQTSWSLS
jgi:hypothetical protein